MKNLTPIILAFFAYILCSTSLSAQNVLFVRGGDGSGGFLEGGSDEQLADITNFTTNSGNHGWGTFAQTLEENGYTVTQIKEGNGGSSGVNFAGMNLEQYDVIVLGSNNAPYSGTQANAIETWVKNGGGLLTISDANFGSSWCDAPSSDQAFLSKFGIVVNQDRGTYVLRSSDGDFLEASHPILAGISAYDGEGVSPFTIASSIPSGVTVERLVQVKPGQQIRLNNSTTGNCQGSSRTANNTDAVMVAASAGEGRVLAHYDRNTFFNQNGAGTNINRFDNKQLAINIFDWLSEDLSTPTALEIDALALINADSDKRIGTLVNNSQINLDITNDANLSVNALTTPTTVGSVRLELTGPISTNRTDNTAPYTLFDTNGSDFSGRKFPPGSYTLSVVPYENANLGGTQGTSTVINFKVIGSSTNPFDGTIDALALINADRDKRIGTLVNNSQINLDITNDANLSVNALTTPTSIGSVQLELSGPISTNRTDNTVPYTLFDTNGDDFSGRKFPPGTYTLRVTPYENGNLQGTQGTPVAINFKVVGSTSPPASSLTFTLIDAARDKEVITLRNGNTLTARYSSNVNIRANTTNTNVRSVLLRLTGTRSLERIENNTPYTLFGAIGDDYTSGSLPGGSYTITAESYAGIGATGTLLESSTINFRILSAASSTTAKNEVPVAAYAYPNPLPPSANFSVKVPEELKGTVSYSVVNAAGIPIETGSMNFMNPQRTVDFELPSLSTKNPGVYYLIIQSNATKHTIPLAKK